MKRVYQFITYLSALIIGVLLLIFCKDETLSRGIVIAVGILFLVPSVMMLINSFAAKKTARGREKAVAWFTILIACAGLVLGAWMLIMPAFFMTVAPYTLGVAMILCGCAAVVFVVNASRPASANPVWYILPALTICGGLVLCFVAAKTGLTFAALFTGIFLICYSASGFSSLGREMRGGNLTN